MEVTEKLMPWKTIVSMVNKGVLSFGRTKFVMDSYFNHKREINGEWRDINSYCKHVKLGYPYSTEVIWVSNDDGTKILRTRKFVPDDADCPGKRVVVLDNQFPYAFSPEVLHKVIWSADELTVEEYEKHVEKLFNEDEYDIVVFINPRNQKSVEGVHHGHAILRKKQRTLTDLVTRELRQPDHECLDRLAGMQRAA